MYPLLCARESKLNDLRPASRSLDEVPAAQLHVFVDYLNPFVWCIHMLKDAKYLCRDYYIGSISVV